MNTTNYSSLFTIVALRRAWYVCNLDAETSSLCRRNGITVEEVAEQEQIRPQREARLWGDWKWHINNRRTDEHLAELLGLSYHSLWAMNMRVDRENMRVYYRIPHPSGEWIEYEERLTEGINDDSSQIPPT
ncbi:hypothetical protein HZA86_05565 [Candidatus Uhrbacteria bacterium]|nr:hypothetical protein [Candidatus Uhrbacteria bacterium]